MVDSRGFRWYLQTYRHVFISTYLYIDGRICQCLYRCIVVDMFTYTVASRTQHLAHVAASLVLLFWGSFMRLTSGQQTGGRQLVTRPTLARAVAALAPTAACRATLDTRTSSVRARTAMTMNMSCTNSQKHSPLACQGYEFHAFRHRKHCFHHEVHCLGHENEA